MVNHKKASNVSMTIKC